MAELNLDNKRIEVIDALRGFAMMSIILLHNIEHFDFYYFPSEFPDWLKATDKAVWETLFFIFGGKSYGIFSILFGFSFFVQLESQKRKGKTFTGRFLWRMLILLVLSALNTTFFEGDIMSFYAVLAIFLVIVQYWDNRSLMIFAGILLFQPWLWFEFFESIINPILGEPSHLSDSYYELIPNYLGSNSFWEVVKYNQTKGRIAMVLWLWENGRFFQAPALFMIGMLLGRTGFFYSSFENFRLWKKLFWIGLASFIILFTLNFFLSTLILNPTSKATFKLIFTTWHNFAFIIILVSSFLLLFQNQRIYRFMTFFIPFGKMSLSNYLLQSILGSIIYYGFGFGLYKYTGASYSLGIAILMIFIQWIFTVWWLKNHKQGPLEWLWHKATWI